MSRITLDVKQSGERSAGNPHATFDEAGAGDGPTIVVRSSRVRQNGRGWQRTRASSRPYAAVGGAAKRRLGATPAGKRCRPQPAAGRQASPRTKCDRFPAFLGSLIGFQKPSAAKPEASHLRTQVLRAWRSFGEPRSEVRGSTRCSGACVSDGSLPL